MKNDSMLDTKSNDKELEKIRKAERTRFAIIQSYKTVASRNNLLLFTLDGDVY